MAKTVTRDLDRRSREQSAQVVLRMSPEQRAAMTRLARRRGTSVTALVLAYLTPDLDETDALDLARITGPDGRQHVTTGKGDTRCGEEV